MAGEWPDDDVMSSFCFVDLFYIAIPTLRRRHEGGRMQVGSVHESDGRFHFCPPHYAIAKASHHRLIILSSSHLALFGVQSITGTTAQ